MSTQSRPTPQSPAPATAAPGSLDGGIGVGGIIFMVAAGAAPLATTVAVFPAIVGVSQSTVSPLFFVVAAVVLAVFAVGFLRMSKDVTDAGSFYAYVHAGLGRIPGRGAATLALVAYLMLFVALAAYLGASTAGTVEYFTGSPTPWWIWSAAWLLITGVLSYRNIELSTKVLGVALVLEVAIMIVLDLVMVIRGGAQGLTAASLNPLQFSEGTASLGLMFAFFGFVGFEATVVFRSEARNHERTVPRATYLSVFGIGLFYAFSLFAVTVGAGVQDVVGLATDSPQTLITGLAGTYLGVAGQQAFQLLVLISVFACFLTFHNVLARYAFNLGSTGMLPAALGKAHPRHHAPSRGSVAVTIACATAILLAIVLGLDPILQVYTWFSGAATLGIITLMGLTSLAVLVFFRGHHGHGWIATRIAPACSLLAFTALVVLIVVNFPLLVGGNTVAIVLTSVLFVALVGGAAVAAVGTKTTSTPRNTATPDPAPAEH